ncbi:GNAT family N-acetyltransferase [Lutispora saccharofermentans]|uniref:GNAT family N-acetyltransferase n=1 Tax=Lutispora saccharofermentans TaxID=3024236 RepID=A0ABT1NK18_9FIRM|nr:GNAT family N-acetyltransferase [Lutispora saccharofermentans]MCQ1531602.1 GNAT family N-acetyltransferase [Lutispora saccharofermentans]
MNRFEFMSGGKELLGFVKPLWEKLNKHHEIKSENFSDKYRNFKFEERKSKFDSYDNSSIKVDLIKDSENDIYIGYCISTINEKSEGEIDSIFVDGECRKFGLGDRLMGRALEWLDCNNAKKKIIGVAEGNEEVLSFYKKYGFYKRTVILEQRNEGGLHDEKA